MEICQIEVSHFYGAFESFDRYLRNFTRSSQDESVINTIYFTIIAIKTQIFIIAINIFIH